MNNIFMEPENWINVTHLHTSLKSEFYIFELYIPLERSSPQI